MTVIFRGNSEEMLRVILRENDNRWGGESW